MNSAAAAEATLNLLWKDRGFPVDPVIIAKELGVEVIETELPPEVSGALLKEAGKSPWIAVHRSDVVTRKRFTCAHELGHYVARVESSDDEREYEYVDFRDQQSANGKNPEEIFANQFAAQLLMPEKEVRKQHAKLTTHMALARYFGVSNEALKFRLKNLGLLGND